MWFLLFPAAAVVAGLVRWACSESPPAQSSNITYEHPPTTALSILERNLFRLRAELKCSVGKKIAVLGQPGAGKSSLVINITQGKAHPAPVVGCNTDATDWSSDLNVFLLTSFDIYIFVDVPGYDTANHPFGSFLSYFPFEQFNSFIVLINGKLHISDLRIIEMVSSTEKPYTIVRTYSESLNDEDRDKVKTDICSQTEIDISHNILFVSNRTKENISLLCNKVL